jgi:ribosome-binding protein aMBF1 (putative translation factor)
MEEHERGPAWVAQKIGRTREYISAVAHGHRPFSDKLAQALTEHLGIQFENDTSDQPARRNRKPRKSATT